MPAWLQPAVELAVMCEQNGIARRIQNPCAARHVPGQAVAMKAAFIGAHEIDEVIHHGRLIRVPFQVFGQGGEQGLSVHIPNCRLMRVAMGGVRSPQFSCSTEASRSTASGTHKVVCSTN